MSDDPDRPRSFTITIEDDGDAWLFDIKRNRVRASDADICSLFAEFRLIVDELHAEAHTLAGYAHPN